MGGGVGGGGEAGRLSAAQKKEALQERMVQIEKGTDKIFQSKAEAQLKVCAWCMCTCMPPFIHVWQYTYICIYIYFCIYILSNIWQSSFIFLEMLQGEAEAQLKVRPLCICTCVPRFIYVWHYICIHTYWRIFDKTYLCFLRSVRVNLRFDLRCVLHVCVHVCYFLFMCDNIRIYTYINVYTYVYVYTHTYVYIYMCIYIDVCVLI